jgi:putative two-component system response regulator
MFTHARILIVDDEPANIQVLRRLLVRADFTRIETTTDPRKAAELYVTHRPDLILLDLHMPEMSGLEVIDQLNAIAEATCLPNMLLEAKVRDRTRALEAAQRRRPERGG